MEERLKDLCVVSWRDPGPAQEHCIVARIYEAAATTFGVRLCGSAYFSLPSKSLELYISYQMSQNRATVHYLDVSSHRLPEGLLFLLDDIIVVVKEVSSCKPHDTRLLYSFESRGAGPSISIPDDAKYAKAAVRHGCGLPQP
jgi:hypothetical protein